MDIMKNFFWIGYSIIESFFFWIAWNSMAPDLVSWGLEIPLTATHITYGTSLGLFILIGFIGSFISKLTPKIISINNSSKSDS